MQHKFTIALARFWKPTEGRGSNLLYPVNYIFLNSGCSVDETSHAPVIQPNCVNSVVGLTIRFTYSLMCSRSSVCLNGITKQGVETYRILTPEDIKIGFCGSRAMSGSNEQIKKYTTKPRKYATKSDKTAWWSRMPDPKTTAVINTKTSPGLRVVFQKR